MINIIHTNSTVYQTTKGRIFKEDEHKYIQEILNEDHR